MDTSPVAFQNYPESKRDEKRFDTMRIVGRPYGRPLVFYDEIKEMMACEKCVFDSGEHSCGK